MRIGQGRRRGPVLLIAAAVAVAATGAAAGVSELSRPGGREVCALFDNTFGLYQDAPVTIRGIAVGKVSEIVPDHDRVRVAMAIDDRSLSAQVRAVVVNSSILTDRRVELVDAQRGGATLPEGQCIAPDRTETPVGVSEALRSFTDLVHDITEPAPDGSTPLRTLLSGADRETQGMGPVIDAELRSLGDLLGSPDDFMSQLGQVLDNSAELSRFLTSQWSDIKTSMITFGPGLELLERTLVIVKVLVGKLAAAVGPMDRLFNHHFPYLMDMLDSSVPLVTLARTRAEQAGDLFATIPGVITMLRGMVERQPGAVSLDYRPPNVVVGAPDPQALCDRIEESGPRVCAALSANAATMPLPLAVLATVGGMP